MSRRFGRGGMVAGGRRRYNRGSARAAEAKGVVTLSEVTSELLSRAVAIYLEIAYPGSPPSEAVRERAALPDSKAGAELLSEERFERVPADAAPENAMRFNLRLGNARYPHMKLGIDRVSNSESFVLVVDTHDRHVAAMVQDGEREAYQALLAHNTGVQERIEQAWTEAGLPTFEQYLRGRLSGLRKGGPQEGAER